MFFKKINRRILCVLLLSIISLSFFFISYATQNDFGIIQWFNNSDNNKENTEKSYIKWFEFNVSYDVLAKTSQLDINSHIKNENVKLNWIELISYLACKYGNNFDKFKSKDLDAVVSRLHSGETMENITKDMKYYSYYFEGYDAVLHEFISEYQIEDTNKNSSTANTEINNELISDESCTETNFITKYGLKAFHPVAKNYGYSHYDDFGASRSYGYKRLHFGNDLMGSIRNTYYCS